MNRAERVNKANEFISSIARCGRKFFFNKGEISRFELDHRNRVWFIDSYSKKRIYTHYKYNWKGFTEGGTLKTLIQKLRDYIMSGKADNLNLGPYPSWLNGGDLWGYGEDMIVVREASKRLMELGYDLGR